MTLIMEKKNYSKNSPEITLLRELIQKSVDFKIRTPADFNSLAELINEKTGEMLSPTTLKRLWGYIDGAETTRQCTLNILTKYLGYKSWDEFIADCEKHYEIQSKPILSYSISSATLNNGQKLILEWMPNRQIVIEYLGENKWIVTESRNSKVQIGDTFICNFFIQNEPLYVESFTHENNEPVPFVMGAKSGLTKLAKL